MEVFVIHIPHNSIYGSDEDKEKKTIQYSCQKIQNNTYFNCGWSQLSFQQTPICTIVDHYSKLLQEKVDIGVIFHFSSFTEHDQNVSSSIQVLLQYLQLKQNETNVFVWKPEAAQ